MAGEGKYGQITVTGKDLPPDEPLFLIRSQDEIGPDAVEAYAMLLEQRALTAEFEELDVVAAKKLRAGVEDCLAFAMRMRRWQIENPERVNALSGAPDEGEER